MLALKCVWTSLHVLLSTCDWALGVAELRINCPYILAEQDPYWEVLCRRECHLKMFFSKLRFRCQRRFAERVSNQGMPSKKRASFANMLRINARHLRMLFVSCISFGYWFSQNVCHIEVILQSDNLWYNGKAGKHAIIAQGSSRSIRKIWKLKSNY